MFGLKPLLGLEPMAPIRPQLLVSHANHSATETSMYVCMYVRTYVRMYTNSFYLFRRTLRNDKSGKILLNLCGAMLLMDVAFLVGAPSYYVDDGLCRTVAVLMHYFLLATFTWMLVEALEMYRALVTVFAKYASWYMAKRCVAAWGELAWQL